MTRLYRYLRRRWLVNRIVANEQRREEAFYKYAYHDSRLRDDRAALARMDRPTVALVRRAE